MLWFKDKQNEKNEMSLCKMSDSVASNQEDLTTPIEDIPPKQEALTLLW